MGTYLLRSCFAKDAHNDRARQCYGVFRCRRCEPDLTKWNGTRPGTGGRPTTTRGTHDPDVLPNGFADRLRHEVPSVIEYLEAIEIRLGRRAHVEAHG